MYCTCLLRLCLQVREFSKCMTTQPLQARNYMDLTLEVTHLHHPKSVQSCITIIGKPMDMSTAAQFATGLVLNPNRTWEARLSSGTDGFATAPLPEGNLTRRDDGSLKDPRGDPPGREACSLNDPIGELAEGLRALGH